MIISIPFLFGELSLVEVIKLLNRLVIAFQNVNFYTYEGILEDEITVRSISVMN